MNSDPKLRVALKDLVLQALQAKLEALNFQIYKHVITRSLYGHYSLCQQLANAAPIPTSNNPLKVGLATPNQQLANAVPTPIWNDPLNNSMAPTDLKLHNTEEVSTPKDPSNASSPTPNQQLANASPILTRNDPLKADKPGPYLILAEIEKKTPLLGGRLNANQSTPNKTFSNLLKRNLQLDNRR